MTRFHHGSLRLKIRLMAALTILIPLLLLLLAATKPASSPARSADINFILISAILLCSLFLYRWDIGGYFLVAVLLPAYVAAAFLRRGALAGIIALGLIALPWLLLRLRPRHKRLDLEFPLKDGLFYVAHGGSSNLSNYHGRFARSQKYALDITQLNPLGVRAKGLAPHQLDHYRIYGATVRSPCAGTIIAAHNGAPDEPPGVRQNQHAPAGNYLQIQPEGTEIQLLLAHLQPGSLLVKTGDTVLAGQLLARVGNSGHTTEPHLHIHAQIGSQIPVPLTFRRRWLVRNSLVWSR